VENNQSVLEIQKAIDDMLDHDRTKSNVTKLTNQGVIQNDTNLE
jgi:hypothetical protein